MSDVAIINEDAIRAYAGKKPYEVVGACIDDGKPFGEVERAYCSQYFTEQFALIEADMAVADCAQSDPAFEGIDMSEPLPAYVQKQKDMYDNVDTDFSRRIADLLEEYDNGIDLMRRAETVPGRFSKSGLVDEGTLKMLHDNGLPYMNTLDKVTPETIVAAAVQDGNHTLSWTDTYGCSNYVHNQMHECGLALGDDAHYDSPEAEQAAREKFSDVLAGLKNAQDMIRDKTPQGVAVYSIIPYHTVKEIRSLGFDYDIKGFSAEGLLDIYDMPPEDMVACADEAGIKWDSSMQRRMDSWIMYHSQSESPMEPAEVVDKVLAAEKIAGASTSNVFERGVADGTFHNGSKVRLYGDETAKQLGKMGYEERSKQSFDDYLDGLRERHGTVKQTGVSAQGNRDIPNAPDFAEGSGVDDMQLN